MAAQRSRFLQQNLAVTTSDDRMIGTDSEHCGIALAIKPDKRLKKIGRTGNLPCSVSKLHRRKMNLPHYSRSECHRD